MILHLTLCVFLSPSLSVLSSHSLPKSQTMDCILVSIPCVSLSLMLLFIGEEDPLCDLHPRSNIIGICITRTRVYIALCFPGRVRKRVYIIHFCETTGTTKSREWLPQGSFCLPLHKKERDLTSSVLILVA
jgi:hypothetical protein